MLFQAVMSLTKGDRYSKHCDLNMNLVYNFVLNAFCLLMEKQECVLKVICCHIRKKKSDPP